MSNKNFLLLSMEDQQIKKISNVISNDSCRKILDFLSNKDATESELAEKLGIPISTVHYNLQQLQDASLVNSEEFHYSKKGKEVNHYRLANKYIIIAPKKTFGIKEKLRGILPVVLIAAGAAGIIQLVSKYLSSSTYQIKEMAAEKIATANQYAGAAAPSLTKSAPEVAKTTNLLTQNLALWFLAGALFALLVYFIVSLIRKDVD